MQYSHILVIYVNEKYIFGVVILSLIANEAHLVSGRYRPGVAYQEYTEIR